MGVVGRFMYSVCYRPELVRWWSLLQISSRGRVWDTDPYLGTGRPVWLFLGGIKPKLRGDLLLHVVMKGQYLNE